MLFRSDEGTVHLYAILERAEESERGDVVKALAEKAGFLVRGLAHHHVRAYSPTKYHTAFDVTVARA